VLPRRIRPGELRHPASPALRSERRPVTKTSSKHIVERFTSEFLPTGDVALAEEFLSPDVVMHFDKRLYNSFGQHPELLLEWFGTHMSLRWRRVDDRITRRSALGLERRVRARAL